MDVSTLKNRIKIKKIPNYLIFTGPEWKVQQIYIEQIAKATNSEIVRINSIKDVFYSLRSKAFLSVSKLFLVRDDTELLQADSNVIQSILDALQSNLLIHVLTAVDKRKKYYKDNKERIIEFEPLPDTILKKYIKKEIITLSDKNCGILIEICEHDYGRILLEIDKLKRYNNVTWENRDERERDGGQYWLNHCFETLVEDGTIHEPPYDAIFDLVDAILDRKPKTAFALLRESYDSGEATMVMLTVLWNNAKALLQTQAYEGKDLAKSSGLTGWQIKNAKKHLGKYSVSELLKMLQLIQQTEIGIKQGKIEDSFAMEYLLCQIL